MCRGAISMRFGTGGRLCRGAMLLYLILLFAEEAVHHYMCGSTLASTDSDTDAKYHALASQLVMLSVGYHSNRQSCSVMHV